jgi:hypothetical protein
MDIIFYDCFAMMSLEFLGHEMAIWKFLLSWVLRVWIYIFDMALVLIPKGDISNGSIVCYYCLISF